MLYFYQLGSFSDLIKSLSWRMALTVCKLTQKQQEQTVCFINSDNVGSIGKVDLYKLQLVIKAWCHFMSFKFLLLIYI